MPYRIEAVGGGGVDPAPFGVHPVFGGVVGLDRQEGARADMQRQRGVADAARAQCRHQPGREVERRGRRGDGTRLAREHRW